MMNQSTLHLYIGTYTRQDSDGIYVCDFDTRTGLLSEPRCVARVDNPTFLVRHPRLPCLYAVCDQVGPEGAATGQALAFRIDAASGALSPMRGQSTRSGRPCHVSVDRAGRTLLFAEYGGSTAGALSLDAEGVPAELHAHFEFEHASGVDVVRQGVAHAHSINVSPDNRHVYVPDLGGDRIYIYRFESETGTLEPSEPAWVSSVPGAGPRHMAFHASSHFACVINELNSTISVYRRDTETGALILSSESSTLPDDFGGDNITADVHFSPDGRYLYGTNRGHDSIVVYAFQAETGELHPLQHVSTQGAHPRNFTIDPTGRFVLVANQDTHNIVVLARDQSSGRLVNTGQDALVSMPVCLIWGNSQTNS